MLIDEERLEKERDGKSWPLARRREINNLSPSCKREEPGQLVRSSLAQLLIRHCPLSPSRVFLSTCLSLSLLLASLAPACSLVLFLSASPHPSPSFRVPLNVAEAICGMQLLLEHVRSDIFLVLDYSCLFDPFASELRGASPFRRNAAENFDCSRFAAFFFSRCSSAERATVNVFFRFWREGLSFDF